MEKEVKKFIEEAQKIRMTGEEKASIRKNILNNIGAPASSSSATEPTSFFGGLNFMAFSAIILLLIVGASYSSIRSKNDEGTFALNQEIELLPMESEKFARDDTSIESAVQLEGGETEATSITPSDLSESDDNASTISNEEIIGKDINKDSIRDDIELYIETEHKDDQATQEALKQYYLSIERAMLGHKDADLSYKNALEVDRAQECLWYVNGDDAAEIQAKVRAKILNTTSRSLAYIEYNASLGGKSFKHIEGSAEACDFDVDSLIRSSANSN